MRASDFVKSDKEMRDTADSLVFTESTNAVNAGIVQHANRSDEQLKDDLLNRESYSQRAGDTSFESVGSEGDIPASPQIASSDAGYGDTSPLGYTSDVAYGSGDATAPFVQQEIMQGQEGAPLTSGRHAAPAMNTATRGAASNAGHSALSAAVANKKARGTIEAQATRHRGADQSVSLVKTQSEHNIRRAIGKRAKAGAKSATTAAIHNGLQGSEFEGYDDAYYRGKNAYKVARWAKRKLTRKAAARSAGSLGALSEKSYQTAKNAKTAADVQRDIQIKRHQMQAHAKAAETAKSSSIKSMISGTTAKTGAGGTAAAAKGGGGFIAGISGGVVLTIILALLSLVLLIGALTGGKEEVTIDGLPSCITYDMVLAAVECQEKFGDPAGASIAQIIKESRISDDTLSGLASPPHHNLYGMKWSKEAIGDERVTGQTNWLTGEHYDSGYTTITDGFCDFRSWRDCIYYRSEVFLNFDHFKYNANVIAAKAEKNSDKMVVGLKEGGWATDPNYIPSLLELLDDYDLRRFDGITVAELEAMGTSSGGGSGEDYNNANAKQKLVVDACYRTPFAGNGYCAAWVTDVYEAAGISSFPGNACDMYWRYCHSTNRDELKVGMIIAVPHSPYGTLGWTYGHVGIYIGDNKVMHNASSIQTSDLDAWINEYSYRCFAGWGWPPGMP